MDCNIQSCFIIEYYSNENSEALLSETSAAKEGSVCIIVSLHSYYLFTGLSNIQPSITTLVIAETGADSKLIKTTVADANQIIWTKKKE